MMKSALLMAVLALTACGTQQKHKSSTPVVMHDTIELVLPDSVGGLTINEALWKRHSSRTYKDEALYLEELSGVVWAAAGVNRPGEAHLTAPSALALYPIRTYAFFAEGVYLYDAMKHRLEKVLNGDYRAISGVQPFVETAPLNLVFIADMSSYEGRQIPAEHVRYLCGQDAAGYAENVNLYASAHGLHSVTRGSASPELLSTLGLDASRYLFALAVTVGR